MSHIISNFILSLFLSHMKCTGFEKLLLMICVTCIKISVPFLHSEGPADHTMKESCGMPISSHIVFLEIVTAISSIGINPYNWTDKNFLFFTKWSIESVALCVKGILATRCRVCCRWPDWTFVLLGRLFMFLAVSSSPNVIFCGFQADLSSTPFFMMRYDRIYSSQEYSGTA